MKYLKKTLCALFVFCALIIGTASPVSGSLAEIENNETDYINENIEYVNEDSDIMPLATLEKPTCIVHTETQYGENDIKADRNVILNNTDVYNMIVRYDWYVGEGGANLALGGNDFGGSVGYSHFGEQFSDYGFPEIGDRYCEPNYLYGKSHINGSYSDSTYLQWTHFYNEKQGSVLYGFDCKYTLVNWLNPAALTTSDFPTEFDQSLNLWEHGGGKTIKATIIYKSQMFHDIEVGIPWVGWKKTTVTMGGVNFTLRAGPKKCSLIVDQSGIKQVDIRFFFGVE